MQEAGEQVGLVGDGEGVRGEEVGLHRSAWERGQSRLLLAMEG